ncbi:MAG: hypothetical protein HYW22_02580 [Candidatus Aenigmarchaeota archaeon]|nr:hypothetical protein [Candidatus Aenigmarchaeota archaeon]
MPSLAQEMHNRENIVSYGRAVYNASKTVIEKAREGYDGLINPSRGANPLVLGIYETVRHMAWTNPDAKALAECMYIGGRTNSAHCFPIVPVPLTADIKIEDVDLSPHHLNEDSLVDGMRYFGAEFIQTLALDPDARQKNRYFRFLDWIFSEFERRPDVSKFYRELPPVKKPIFIDTAISGRACTTILGPLDATGFPAYPIIFADGNGNRLRDPYKNYLRRRERSGYIRFLGMDRILSEDQGAALLGYWATFYPQLLIAAMNNKWLPYASTVTWHDVHEKKDSRMLASYRDTFDSFMDLITDVTGALYSLDVEYGNLDGESNKDILDFLGEGKFDDKMNEVISKMRRYGVPRIEDPVSMADEFPFEIDHEKSFETRSHVAHIWLPQSDINTKLQDLHSHLFLGNA